MNRDIGTKLKKLRESAGYTLEFVGKVVGVSRATVQRYESGEIKNIPLDKIAKLTTLYNVSMVKLLELEVKGHDGESCEFNKLVDISDTRYLKAEEVSLLAAFEKLNEEGKNKLLGLAYDLCDIPKYTSKKKDTSA